MQQKELFNKYPKAERIFLLKRSKIHSRGAKIFDVIIGMFTPAASVIDDADKLSDLSSYFLVEMKERSLLVRIEKGTVDEIASVEVEGKTFEYDGNRFKKSFEVKR